jgi:HEAT repeat protein
VPTSWFRRILAAGVIAAAVLIAGASAFLTRRHPRDRTLASINDPSIAAIREMVARGDISQAATRLSRDYRFGNTAGLVALQDFSLLVLQRGLKANDLFDRCFAESALAEGGQTQALQKLVNTFVRNPDLSVKMAVADGLGDLGDGEAVAILAHLYHHGDTLDRRFVVNALSSTADPGAVAVLRDAARQSDPTLRMAALKGLGRLANSTALPLLRLALARGQIFDKVMAAESLLKMGDRSGVGRLLATLKDHSQGNARAMAAVALGYAQEPSLVPTLRQALSDQNIDVRLGAAAALTHYNDAGAVSYLRGAVRDADKVTRLHTAQLFGDMSFEAARPAVIDALSSHDAEVQLAAIKTIGTSGGPREIPLLDVLLHDNQDPITRAQVAWALGRISSPQGIPTLLAMVQEPNSTVRYTAADGLDHTAMHLLAGRRLSSR